MSSVPLAEPASVSESENTPAVSVILIVRNGADFIADALRSIYLSDLQPLEILVIDGGSDDATVSIAQQFPKVRICPQISHGIPNAYNEGIAQAQGDFIAFISHDDEWMPHKLDRQLAALQAHPQFAYSLGLVEHFLHSGSAVPEGFRQELLVAARPGWIMEALVARRELFMSVGGFDASFAVGEDSDWFARTLDAGFTPMMLPEVLVRKRVHDRNSSLLNPDINHLLLRALRRSIQRKRTGKAIDE
ncbi:glycosyltransferase [Methylovulum psychrotolerans]|uniref:Glycosyltransferase family 2 protein n=1 Tax=Methylovulum psychrotolerans TaxID=1704499 RepID=A0A2S5CSR2_9GAMM|nr:glycosyltransferase [Methylovulum psychrotolerans]POZ53861.1 glycosyltransferase family 2 protein [Methylovulum psychrotolerans]